MIIVEFFGNILVGILVGYLSLTNSLAALLLPNQEPPHQELVVIESPDETIQPDTNKLSTLESKYEYGGIIPTILLESAAYQQAAVLAGAQEEPLELFEKEKELPEKITDALVNIYCQFSTEDYVRTTTGTGFLIHQNGVILTNAHVAQFLLFEDIEKVVSTECIIRGGNPATPLYVADLLYLPPTWITENAKLISAETPRGTGERDYALLYITEALGTNVLPEHFAALQVETELMNRSTEGDTVYAAGYPAKKLFDEGPEAPLLPQVATTTVQELYTFTSNYADIFSIYNSAVGEQGSSGGPIIRENGNVIGLIVTKGDSGSLDSKSLRGLTLSYIDRTITEETGFSLLENMQGDLAHRSKIFKEALAPFLSRLLEFELE